MIINKLETRIEVKADEGKVLTNWNKVDVKEFTFSGMMYCPLNKDLSDYYEMTEEEKDNILQLMYENDGK
jgi:hypothetical protein